MSREVDLKTRERRAHAASLARLVVQARTDRVGTRVPRAGDDSTEDADAIRDRAGWRIELDDDAAIITDTNEGRVACLALARARVEARVVGDPDERFGHVRIVDREPQRHPAGAIERLEPALDAPSPSAGDPDDETAGVTVQRRAWSRSTERTWVGRGGRRTQRDSDRDARDADQGTTHLWTVPGSWCRVVSAVRPPPGG